MPGGFRKSYEGEDELIYNSYLYEVDLFGDTGNEVVTALMLVFTVFSLSFVLSSYTGLRRRSYFRLRTLGCSRKKLDLMILAECGLAVVIPAALGLILIYLVGMAVCAAIANSLGLHGFFAFDGQMLLLQILSILAAIAVSVAFALFRMRDKRLRPSSAALSPKDIGKLRKALPKLTKKRETDIFERKRLLMKRSRIAAMVFTMAAMGFLLFCGTKIYQAVHTYAALDEEADFEIIIRDPEELFIETKEYVADDGEILPADPGEGSFATVSNPYCGLTEEELSFLWELPGITKISGKVYDSWHLMSWDGIEERADLSVSSKIVDG